MSFAKYSINEMSEMLAILKLEQEDLQKHLEKATTQMEADWIKMRTNLLVATIDEIMCEIEKWEQLMWRFQMSKVVEEIPEKYEEFEYKYYYQMGLREWFRYILCDAKVKAQEFADRSNEQSLTRMRFRNILDDVVEKSHEFFQRSCELYLARIRFDRVFDEFKQFLSMY